MQEVLMIATQKDGLRAEAVGWSYEDPSCFDKIAYKPIGLSGYSRNPPFYAYDCVLRALANGWHLLAPPEKTQFEVEWEKGDFRTITEWNWYLVRDVKE